MSDTTPWDQLQKSKVERVVPGIAIWVAFHEQAHRYDRRLLVRREHCLWDSNRTKQRNFADHMNMHPSHLTFSFINESENVDYVSQQHHVDEFMQHPSCYPQLVSKTMYTLTSNQHTYLLSPPDETILLGKPRQGISLLSTQRQTNTTYRS